MASRSRTSASASAIRLRERCGVTIDGLLRADLVLQMRPGLFVTAPAP
jgi:hypothetical protein